jgi:2-C-methyl-D-erythritol 4-phosphate cytidylyltransferase/2-C-methyl-D-erythritol 2,4-cyclodiphosphate synthase
MHKDFHAIIVAAGQGQRFGGDLPKQYCPLNGKPVLRYCLDVFAVMENCLSICVVIDEEHQDLFTAATKSFSKDISIVIGGTQRHESVCNALMSLTTIDKDSPVLIHDAARPFVSTKNIEDVVSAVYDKDCATLAVPTVDTLRYANNGCIAESSSAAPTHPSRDDLWSVQTPQGFKYGLIHEAHQRAKHDLLGYEGVTDDTALVQKSGHSVEIVKGDRLNFKITQIEDFAMAEHILMRPRIAKMATGYDVHAFEEYEVVGNHIKLGGILIPHKYELKGHSDADVALHALSDALYGLISDGDIGMHFPPSDNAHKGQDSAVFLTAASDAVKKQDGIIRHVDLTIICEKPAIGPHRDDMRKNIAELMGLDIKNVSVKATTTEGLGFTGRREGMAVQAAVSADFPSADTGSE